MSDIKITDFNTIFESNGFRIGCIGNSQFKSYYLITVSQHTVSTMIGIKLLPDDVNRIMNASESDADKIVRAIINRPYQGYIDVL